MIIDYTQAPSGNCPVQAEGYIEGHPFYFRSRGEYWALYVSPRKEDREVFDPFFHDTWIYLEEYKGEVWNYWRGTGEESPLMCAGWAYTEECIEYIERKAEEFLNEVV
jgi:hypothetical protein